MSLPKWKMIANFPEKTMIRKDFTPPFGAATGIFQFTSKHLERHLLFHQDADYVFGVNSLAIGTVKFPVHLLCYVLMDSHLHLLLEGSFPDCCAYYDWVMLRLARSGTSSIWGMWTFPWSGTHRCYAMKLPINSGTPTKRGYAAHCLIDGVRPTCCSGRIWIMSGASPSRVLRKRGCCSIPGSIFLPTGSTGADAC